MLDAETKEENILEADMIQLHYLLALKKKKKKNDTTSMHGIKSRTSAVHKKWLDTTELTLYGH